MKILFLHGWQSVPGGLKPTYLARNGHTVLNPKLPDDDFAEAVGIAQDLFNRHKPDVVVGSSRGGAVAMNIESGAVKLVLLCPAWKKYGSVKTVKPGTAILHSRGDDVVPFADSEELVRNSGIPADTLIDVGSELAMLRASSPPGTGGVARSAGVVDQPQTDSVLNGAYLIYHPVCSFVADTPPVPGGELSL